MVTVRKKQTGKTYFYKNRGGQVIQLTAQVGSFSDLQGCQMQARP